ncbi:MAG: chromosomal replication initiator protein DnaA [Planctomycetes bacterium]|nr:chromosomal replication initiator protein DnaA [Planctomycetota bacterium]
MQNTSHSLDHGASSWEEVLVELRKRVRTDQYATWFVHLRPVEITKNQVRLSVPNTFYRDWLERKYGEVIESAFRSVLDWEPTISFIVDESAPRTAAPQEGAGTAMLNPQYTFANFIVGQCNRLAHAASLAVAESPGTAYNPLFIHGGAGLGKTHLLQGICHALIAKKADTRVLFLSCEEFMNQFISAIQHGSLEAFRAEHRSPDIIAIDDVHFLARGESTQEEFFHTFNTLYNAQKQIVLTSDRAPEDIATLEERLISRFKWGLVSRMDLPDFETRVAIIQHKARLREVDLPEDVIHFVAAHVDSNIRELEGAITKIAGFASLANRTIDISLAREALEDMTPTSKPISIEEIQSLVTRRYNVKLSDLQSKKKSKSIAFPRQICMCLARRLTNHSLEEIGGYFGGRDHTTVMYADEKIRQMVAQDSTLRLALQEMETELRKKK